MLKRIKIQTHLALIANLTKKIRSGLDIRCFTDLYSVHINVPTNVI